MKKYSLTDETRQFLGKTLYRIKAEISFKDIKKGQLGGYVENDANLSHQMDAWVYGDARVYGNAGVYGKARVYGNAGVSGNAWVSGNASVYGNARVSGDAEVSGLCLVHIIGLNWDITISDYHIQIGCELHTIEQWEKFTDKEILDMGPNSLNWWKDFRSIILKIAKQR